MLNPWLILGLLIAMLAAIVRAYFYGYDVAVGDVAKEKNRQIVATITAHNSQARRDIAAARLSEQNRWKRRLADQQATTDLVADINRRKPSDPCKMECDLDSVSFDLLRQRINRANSPADQNPTGISADRVPTPPVAR